MRTLSQKTRTCGGCCGAFALTNAFREWKTKTACSAQSGWKNSTGAITDSPGVRAAPSAAGRPPQARRGGCRRTRRRSAWPSPGRRWEDRPQPRRRDLVQLDKRRPLDDPADARPRVVRPLEVRLALDDKRHPARVDVVVERRDEPVRAHRLVQDDAHPPPVAAEEVPHLPAHSSQSRSSSGNCEDLVGFILGDLFIPFIGSLS